MRRVLGVCAGLFGACGVAAAALGAHAAGAEHMNAVALVLLAHAVALLALSRRDGVFWRAAGLLLAFGAALFSLDVTLLTLASTRLFPLAAPTGGFAMIFGWLAVGVAAFRDSYPANA